MNVAVAAPLSVVTASLMPFTISKEEKGFNHIVVEEIATRAGLDVAINYMPWKRAQKVAKETADTLIIGMSRTSSREPNYAWIAPLLQVNEVMVATSQTFDSIEAAQKAGKIGVLAGTPRERKLKQAGVSAVVAINDPESAAKMLKSGRIVAWYTHDKRAAYFWKQLGGSGQPLKMGKPLADGTVYLAAHKSFPEEVQESLRQALQAMRDDGSYDKLHAEHFGS